MNSFSNRNQDNNCFSLNTSSQNIALSSMNQVASNMKIILEAITESVVWVDELQQIQWLNSSFRNLIGKSNQELLGANLIEILPLLLNGQSVSLESYPSTKIQQKDYQTQEYEFIQGEKSLYLEISGDCVVEQDNSKTAILVINNKTNNQQLNTPIAVSIRELKYRHILENSQVGIGRICRVDGLILDANQRFAEMLGYTSAEQLIEKKYTHEFEVIKSDRAQIHIELAEKGEIPNREIQLRRRDGSLIWVLLWGCLNVEEDSIEFIIADISERKQAEEILRQREAQYRDLVETANSIILRWDIDGYICFINDYGQKFFGFKRNELLGQHVIGTIVPETETSGRDLRSLIQDIADNPENYAVNEYENICQNKERVWISWANKPIFDDYGNLIEILSVGTDITERKQTETALRRSELKFRNLFSNSQVGIYRCKCEESIVLDANQRFAELLGYDSPSEIIGEKLSNQFCVGSEIHQQILNQLQQKGEINNLEWQFPQQDGSIRWGLYSARLNREENCIEGVVIDISDRKKAQAALSLTNAMLEAQQEAAPDGILVVDENNQVISYNRRFCELWQISEESIMTYSPEERMKRCSSLLVNPDDCLVKVKTLKQNRTAISQDEISCKDGRVLDRYSSPVTSNTGDYYGRIWYFRDITERKNKEESLRLIVEGTAAQVGQDFFRSCTRSLARLLEVRYAFIAEFTNEAKDKARTLACWWGNDFKENCEYELAATPSAEVLKGVRCRYPHSIQKLFPQDSYLRQFDVESFIGLPITNMQGNILGILAVMDDKPLNNQNCEVQCSIVSIFAARAGAELERKYAEIALAKQLQRALLLEKITQDIRQSLELQEVLQTTVNQIGEIFQVDRCLIFDYQAKPIAKAHVVAEYIISDYSPMLGTEMMLKDVVCLKQAFAQEQALALTDVHNEPSLQSSVFIYQQFEIKSLMSVSTSYQGKPNGAIVIHQCDRLRQWTQEEVELIQAVADQVGIAIAQAQLLTQEKQQRQALEEAKQNAEVANKAKSEFLANMSHELRTPLNAILGFTQLMERDSAITTKQQASLSIVSKSGEHLLHLINDVLEMSKIEAGQTKLQPKIFNLHRMLHYLKAMFQPLAQAQKISFHFQAAQGLVEYIKTDEIKLRQVLINLLDNAIKFTDKGSVTLRVLSLREIPVGNAPVTNNKAKLIFEIEDTGIGIAEKEMELLFQPFVQTAADINKFGGTGLGLAISQHFVNLMGGKINLVSTLGEGSTFSFDIQVDLVSLPVESANSLLKPVVRIASGQPSYRILIVDDQKENRHLLTELLQKVGFQTRSATNGMEAIALWQEWQPHLIWMDMRMPIMDGYEAIQKIKQQSQAKKPIIIAVTASALAEQREKILASGCDDLVNKPFESEIIFQKMSEHLGVTYLYENEPLAVTPNWNKSKQSSLSDSGVSSTLLPAITLTPDNLKIMPLDWIQALHQAAIRVDAELILQLIAEIPQSHSVLINQLTTLTHNYNFDEIIELSDSSL